MIAVRISAELETRLDRLAQLTGRIIRFLRERVANDPRAVGEALKGSLAHLWCYRVGDYRIVSDISDGTVKVIVLKIGHRREVYK